MTAVAFDTLKLAEKLQGSGFTRKQASGAAEALAEALTDRPSKEAVIGAVQDSAVGINRRIESAEKRLSGQIDDVKSEVKGVRDSVAIINENQLETNRALNAIMAHLGIPKG